MHQERARALRLPGHDSGRDAVHRVREVGVGLGAIDGGVRGRVHDHVGPRVANARHDLVGPRKVQARALVRHDLRDAVELANDLGADLTAGAGHEHPDHGKDSACASGVPTASFGLRSGAALSGHWTPTAASFQRSVRSCSGA